MNIPLESYYNRFTQECRSVGKLLAEKKHNNISLSESQAQAIEIVAKTLEARRNYFSVLHPEECEKALIAMGLTYASHQAKETLNDDTAISMKDFIIFHGDSRIKGIREEMERILGLDVGYWSSRSMDLDPRIIVTSSKNVEKVNGNFSRFLPKNQISLVIGDSVDLFTRSQQTYISDVFSDSVRIGLMSIINRKKIKSITNTWGKIIDPNIKEDTSPKTNESGFFEFQGKTYGTITRWHLRLGIGKKAITSRVIEHGLKVMATPSHNSYQRNYYCEEDILSACKDLLKSPKADESGYFEINGKKYTTQKTLEKVFGISASTIDKRVKENGIEPKKGLTYFNRPQDYYCEAEVKKACKDLLLIKYQLDDNGFLYIDGIRHGNQTAWCNELGITNSSWENKNVKQSAYSAKNYKGKKCAIYAEHDVRASFAEFININNKADENGFFELNKEKYGTYFAWSKYFGISTNAIEKRIDISKSIRGINSKNKLHDFYSESYICESCSDLIKKPRADENGYIIISGERYASMTKFTEIFGIGRNKITTKIKEANIRMIEGKDSRGHDCIFYSEADILACCKDLISLPRADKSGFFELNEEIYVTKKRWARYLDIPNQKINELIKKSTIKPIEGRDFVGHIRDFYSESDMIKHCEQISEKYEEKLFDMIKNNSLPKFKVKEGSILHRGISGDIIYVIPKQFNALYKKIFQKYQIEDISGKVIGIINNSPVILTESELTPLSHTVSISPKKNKNNEINDKKTADKLISENKKLTRIVFNRHFRAYMHIEEDLMQEGFFGLINANEGYDPEKGKTFKNYAYKSILRSMMRYISNCNLPVRISVNSNETIWKIESYQLYFYARNNRYPTNEETAKFFDITEEKVADTFLVKNNKKNISIDSKRPDGDEYLNYKYIKELICNDNERIEQKDIINILQECKKAFFQCKIRINSDNKIGIQEYWKIFLARIGLTENGEDTDVITLKDLGRIYGVTKQRMNQIEKIIFKTMGKIITKLIQ